MSLLALSTVLDYAKRQREAQEMKRQAAADIQQSSARALGAPTYNVQAAEVNRKASQMTRPDPLSGVQDYVSSKRKPKQEDEDALESLLPPSYRR